jgi:hypothetical protein
MYVEPTSWLGLGAGTGLLTGRELDVRVEGRGARERAG